MSHANIGGARSRYSDKYQLITRGDIKVFLPPIGMYFLLKLWDIDGGSDSLQAA